MGDLIQLFRDDAPPADYGFVFDDHVTEEVMDIIAGVSYDLGRVEQIDSFEEFKATMTSIKERVASLPDG